MVVRDYYQNPTIKKNNPRKLIHGSVVTRVNFPKAGNMEFQSTTILTPGGGTSSSSSSIQGSKFHKLPSSDSFRELRPSPRSSAMMDIREAGLWKLSLFCSKFHQVCITWVFHIKVYPQASQVQWQSPGLPWRNVQWVLSSADAETSRALAPQIKRQQGQQELATLDQARNWGHWACWFFELLHHGLHTKAALSYIFPLLIGMRHRVIITMGVRASIAIFATPWSESLPQHVGATEGSTTNNVNPGDQFAGLSSEEHKAN